MTARVREKDQAKPSQKSGGKLIKKHKGKAKR